MEAKLTPAQQKTIWGRVLADSYGSESLKTLKDAGIDLSTGTWPAMIIAIPFLPNRRARTRSLHPSNSFRLAIRFIRELVHALETPYCEVEAYEPLARVIHLKPSIEREMNPTRLLETADILQKILSRRWALAEHNPQQNAIAYLRWEVRNRTGHAHDTELTDLLSAVFKAAGQQGGFRMEYAALKKILRNETNTRMALRRKVRSLRAR